MPQNQRVVAAAAASALILRGTNGNLELDGKVALVTGASEGLGRASALALAEAGCAVAICARRPEPLQEVHDAVRERGGRVLSVSADVSTKDGVARVFDRLRQELGG